jgi:ubiquinone biosynthesis protein UbiJ
VTLALDAVNRALERESWAREKLAAHAGRTVRFRSGPIERTIAIEASGRLVEGASKPDLTLSVSPLHVPALLATPERWSELVRAEGDASLAATFAELTQTLPWFVERAFAGVLGPIVGQQVSDAGRRLLDLSRYAADRFSESFARYVRDEAKLAVGEQEARSFADDVAQIAARTDALVARVDALALQEDAARKASP